MWGGSVLFYQRKAISSTQRYVEFFKSQFLSPASTQSLRNWDSFFRFQNFYSINVITSLCKHDVKHVATCSDEARPRLWRTIGKDLWNSKVLSIYRKWGYLGQKFAILDETPENAPSRAKISNLGWLEIKCPILEENSKNWMCRSKFLMAYYH